MRILSRCKQVSSLSITALALLLASNLATADIYKWRNNRGVIQYADKPPVSGFSKADKHEIVNSLQSKDMCAEPTAKTAAAATTKFSANFFGNIGSASNIFGFNRNTTKPSAAFTIFNTAPKPVAVVTVPRPLPVVVAAAPITVAPKPVAAAPTLPKPINVAAAPTNVPNPATAPPPSTTQNIIQTMLMPAVDINRNMIPASGYDTLRISASSNPPVVSDQGIGSFRITCTTSHMSNDDPLVYPNQLGAAHHHTFFGNTSVNFKSNLNTFSSTGNSTCAGGIANRTAYWIPSMIDTSTSTPLSPDKIQAYYKSGYGGVPASQIKAPPKGLRMIAGNSKNTTSPPLYSLHPTYSCRLPNGSTVSTLATIPACSAGSGMEMDIEFPQCWDGINLDSPDHKSHMAYANRGCPSTHPVAIPVITIIAYYKVTDIAGTRNWRLASDNYAAGSYNAGYSGHADWVNGWDEAIMAGIIKECINPAKDCRTNLIGPGKDIY